MPASKTSASGNDRFHALIPASLSKAEKASIVALALAVLKGRNRPGRAIRKPRDIEDLLRLKLSGRRNQAFRVIYLDTRHRLIEMPDRHESPGAPAPLTHPANRARPFDMLMAVLHWHGA